MNTQDVARCNLYTTDERGAEIIKREYFRLTPKENEDIESAKKLGLPVDYDFSNLDKARLETILARHPPFEHVIIDLPRE